LTVLTSPLDSKLAERARKELVEALGEDKVNTNKAVLFTYSGTALPFPKTMPDIVVRPATAIARATDAMGDRLLIDGIAEGVASLASRVGGLFAEVQSGDGQWYAALMATGVVLFIAAAVWLVR